MIGCELSYSVNKSRLVLFYICGFRCQQQPITLPYKSLSSLTNPSPKINALPYSIMPISFLDLPGELRNKIYEACLVHHHDVYLNLANQCFRHRPGLFLANKIISRETISIFYAQNRFDFNLDDSTDLIKYRDMIGHENARRIQHVRIFDIFLYEPDPGCEPDPLVPQDLDTDFLNTLKKFFPNVRTLVTSLCLCDGNEEDYIRKYPKHVGEALRISNNHIKSIFPSPPEIILQTYKFYPIEIIQEEIESVGWTPDEGADENCSLCLYETWEDRKFDLFALRLPKPQRLPHVTHYSAPASPVKSDSFVTWEKDMKPGPIGVVPGLPSR